jgi:segregation and condensation protein A
MNTIATQQPLDDYHVDLAVFHGPLDLLLHLIKKEEVDIYDIPIARITRQYLKYIELMQTLNLEVAGEFILMAATLIRIKTRLLLPRDETDLDEPDPREELILALVEYKKYREAGEILREKALLEERNFVPPSPAGKDNMIIDEYPQVSLFDLVSAFKEIMETRRDESFHEVGVEDVSIEDRMEAVMRILQDKEHATFPEVLTDVARRIVAVVTFVALLELARARRITILQSRPFGELRIYRGKRFAAPQDAVDLISFPKPQEQVVS